MGRELIRIVIACVVALTGLAGFSPAMARDLFAQSCVLPADEELTLIDAQLTRGWICDPAKIDAAAQHSWVRLPIDADQRVETRLVGDAMAMDGIVIAKVMRDGSKSADYISARQIVQNWTTGTRYALPLDLRGVDMLYLRYDKPLGPDAASSISFEQPADVEWQRWTSLTILGIIIGMLMLNVVITAFIAMAVQRRFAWYHCAFSALLIVYIASSGSLGFLVFPDMALWTRSVISYAAAAWAIALLCPFILDFFEEGMISERLRKAGTAAAWLVFFAGLLLPLGALFDVSLRLYYNLAFLPGAGLTLYATAKALKNGSSAARAFALAWAVPTLFALERVFRNLGFYRLPPLADFAFYGALALEAGILTVAIGWMVSRIRRERDRALAERELMEIEARRDPLTALPNRRDYNSRIWRTGETLALLDLDHFKSINDRFGHATGDEVLKVVGSVLDQAVADGTIAGAWRMGGEEFAIAIEANPPQHPAVAINAVRARIPYAVSSSLAGIKLHVTASAGLAEVDTGKLDATYRAADRMLYSAKVAGRDRLCFGGREGTAPPAASQPVPAAPPQPEADPQQAAQLNRSRNSSYPKAFTSSSESEALSQSQIDGKGTPLNVLVFTME